MLGRRPMGRRSRHRRGLPSRLFLSEQRTGRGKQIRPVSPPNRTLLSRPLRRTGHTPRTSRIQTKTSFRPRPGAAAQAALSINASTRTKMHPSVTWAYRPRSLTMLAPEEAKRPSIILTAWTWMVFRHDHVLFLSLSGCTRHLRPPEG